MKLRSALFALLIVSFLLLAPYLLLRATGYRIDYAHRKIVATGSIAITAFPTDAAVEIQKNGKNQKIRKRPGRLTPTVLESNLLPGTYRVAAHTPNSNLWEKTITVEESKTSSYPFARLFPQTYAPAGLLPRAPRGLTTDSDAKMLIGWDERGFFGAPLDSTPIDIESLQQLLAGDVQDAQWLNRTKVLLLQFRNGASLLLFGFQEGEPQKIVLLPKNLLHVVEMENRVLIAQQGSNLLRIDTNTSYSHVNTLMNDISAFTIQGKRIIFLDAQGVLWSQANDSSVEQRTIIPFQGNMTGAKLVASADGKTILMRDGDESAWSLDAESDRFVHIADGIRDIEISLDGAKALLVGRHELSYVALKDRLDQPKRDKYSHETIARFDTIISRAAFLPPENEHAVVLVGTTLRVIELDGRGGRNETQYENIEYFTFAAHPARLILVSTKNTIGKVQIPLPGLFDRLGPQTPR